MNTLPRTKELADACEALQRHHEHQSKKTTHAPAFHERLAMKFKDAARSLRAAEKLLQQGESRAPPHT